ncbi:serine/threonine protein kinase [Colletotrichum sojae]|uniref:Serine/threonine protein kinase n=1 Tax=Colletotrichum sojae TaxID=2175907 RepID=A0A8H6IXU8_9PEZI|nr:serine/threonine protein kinase [Colletotrichum sojae]
MPSTERPRTGPRDVKQRSQEYIPVEDLDEEVVRNYMSSLFRGQNMSCSYAWRNGYRYTLPRPLAQEERDTLYSRARFRSGNCHEEGALVAVPRRRLAQRGEDGSGDGVHSGGAADPPDAADASDLVVPCLYRLKDEMETGWYRADAAPSMFLDIDVHSERRDEIIDGIYGTEVGCGETSKVYAVEGRLIPGRTATEPFPLAAGDLESFFLGDHDDNEALIPRRNSLWAQFLGLVSAVAHLHDAKSAGMIHRAITASNILVYRDEKTGQLVLKLARFGQSVGEHDELAWETGSAAQLATVSYDDPPVRYRCVTGKGSEARRLPSLEDLRRNDVWRLDCVLTQLCFFAVGGSRGVKRFGVSIAVEGEDSGFDWLGDGRPAGPRFDDGDGVKRQHTDWADCRYDDGTRIAKLYPGSRVSVFARWGLGIKKWTESLTNRSTPSPSSSVARPPPSSGERVRVVWEFGIDNLSTILSQDEASRYKESCVVYFPGGKPVLSPSAWSVDRYSESAAASAGTATSSPASLSQGRNYAHEHGLLHAQDVDAKLAAIEMAAAGLNKSQSTLGEKPV